VTGSPTVRRLEVEDTEALFQLRQSALHNEPLAFAATPGGERARPSFTRAALEARDEQAVFGGFAGGELCGMVGVMREAGAKERHRGYVWGMYVAPPQRRRGLARALLQAAIDHAGGWPEVVQLCLGVTEPSAAARRLYESVGFRVWGHQPRSMCWQGRFIDEDHMALDLRPPG
jgi:RimJ/RimL family protein N-acetyltransferase